MSIFLQLKKSIVLITLLCFLIVISADLTKFLIPPQSAKQVSVLALCGLFFFWSTVNAQLIGEQNFSPVFIRLLRFSHKSFWGYKGDYIIDSKGVNSKLGSYSKDKWGCLWTWRSFILTLTQHAQWALFIFKTMLYSTTTLSVSFQLTVEMPCHLLHKTQWDDFFKILLFLVF